ncbi:hypothetical protein JCM1840_000865 [Sporobolomyces johnsonii]
MATATRTRPPPVVSSLSPFASTPRQRFVSLLLVTTLVGTTLSVLRTSAATTAFRSRLPASTLTRLTSSESAFPVPSLPFFADKRNVLNQLFVKRSWGWVTALFIAHALALFLTAPLLTVKKPSSSSSSSSPSSPSNGAAPAQPSVSLSPAARVPFTLLLTALRRYLLATLFWFYLTQATWFGTSLGPSVSRRILRSSGAICVPSALSSGPDVSSHGLHGDGGPRSGSVGACTGQPGEYWRGGHDVSGHAFMMLHCALFLFELVHPLLPSLLPAYFTATSPEARARKLPRAVKVTAWAAIGVMALCWWMLLMTSLFFHSPAEKLSGVAFGVLGWYVSGL